MVYVSSLWGWLFLLAVSIDGMGAWQMSEKWLANRYKIGYIAYMHKRPVCSPLWVPLKGPHFAFKSV